MSLVSDNIPNLANGISQQPASLRLITQGQEQVNMYPSLVEGLIKRPPTRFIKELMSSHEGQAALHFIDRDGSQRYLLMVTADQGIKVYDLEGNEKTVTVDSGVDYISCSDPKKDLRFLTIADYTFVVNKNYRVQQESEPVLTRGMEGLIHIKQANYATDYTAIVNGVTASYTTPDGVGTVSDPPDKISTELVASNLKTSLAAALPSSFTIIQSGSVIYLKYGTGVSVSGRAFASTADYSGFKSSDGTSSSSNHTFVNDGGTTLYLEPSVDNSIVDNKFKVENTATPAYKGDHRVKAVIRHTMLDGAYDDPSGWQSSPFREATEENPPWIEISLMQGSTTIGTWRINNKWEGGVETFNFNLTSSQINNITDYNNLYIKAKAYSGYYDRLSITVNPENYMGSIMRLCHVQFICPGDGAYTTLDIETKDSRGDTQMGASTHTVQRFTDLPTKATHGFTTKVLGSDTTEYDDYYVEFVQDEPESNKIKTGHWIETVNPEDNVGFNRASMPHVLIHNDDSTFTLKQGEWGVREAGDKDTAPLPEFVNRQIQDVFMYRNRLGFLSDDTVTLSRAGEFFEFFPETVTTILDSDPIHIAASRDGVAYLKAAIDFEEELLIFAKNSQFKISSGDVASPETTAVPGVGSYIVDTNVRPSASGKNIYFATPFGEYSHIYEMYVNPDEDKIVAADVTSHVTNYIPGNVKKLVTSPNADLVCVLTEEVPNTMYCYKFYWNGSDKLQSAWFKAEFGAAINDAVFVDSDLYLIMQYGTAKQLVHMDFSDLHIEIGHSTFTPFIDRLITEEALISNTYDSGLDITSMVLPYTPVTSEVVVVDRTTLLRNSVTLEGNTVIMTGDRTTDQVFIGEPYTGYYVFSEQFLKKTEGQSEVAVTTGRLQYRRWSVIHGLSGHFKVQVIPDFGPSYEYVYTGRLLGSENNIIGQVALESGTFKFPVKSKSDRVKVKIINDSYLPSSFLSAEWEAFYTTRSDQI